jgi:hypothetical protein
MWQGQEYKKHKRPSFTISPNKEKKLAQSVNPGVILGGF